MVKYSKWIMLFIIGLVVLSIWAIYPPGDKIKLGLDLKGGTHLVLEADITKLPPGESIEEAVTTAIETIRNRVDALGLKEPTITRQGKKRIIVDIAAHSLEFKLLNEKEDINDILITGKIPSENEIFYDEKENPYLVEKKILLSGSRIRDARVEIGSENKPYILLSLDSEGADIFSQLANKYGGKKLAIIFDSIVKCTPIIKTREVEEKSPEDIFIKVSSPKENLIIEGNFTSREASDLQSVLKSGTSPVDIIKQMALLEFKLLDEKGDMNKALQGEIPPQDQILYDLEGRPYLLKKETLLTGKSITDTRVQINQWGQPYITLTLDKEGAKKFAEITGTHVGERLAIILDNVVKSAPNINERIPDGKAVIEGNFDMESANKLRIVLKSGALPVPFKIIQNTTVGPSLGRDSIQKGFLAGIIGLIVVIIFMGIYYKKAGLIADIALILNLLFLMAILAALKATLTLPGIAGIILTIGMSIDANVIIFERIREELGAERAPRPAVDAGYNRAMITILDANITTLIVALVLFQFGTGPIKGFATTLSIGILVSMFTAIIVTRVIFNLLLQKRPVKRLSI